MRRNTWLIAALLFGSGFCALVYQIGWVREFRLIFGASTAASAAVLAVFIGGLGIGGLLLGPRADRHTRPLLFLLAARNDRCGIGGAQSVPAFACSNGVPRQRWFGNASVRHWRRQAVSF
jgi:MFS family permease